MLKGLSDKNYPIVIFILVKKINYKIKRISIWSFASLWCM